MNNRKVQCILLLLFHAASVYVCAQEKKVTLAFSSIAPYSEKALPGGGLLTALNKAAFQAAGWQLSLREVPAARVYMEAREGLVDGFLMGMEGSTAQGFLWSYPVLESEMVVAVASGSPLVTSQREGLKTVTLGIVRGFGLESAFPDFNFELATDPLSNFRKLLVNRIDGIIEEKFSLIWLIRKEGSPEASAVRILLPSLKTSNFVTGFSLKDPLAPVKQKALNRGLEIIRADGTYSRILREYEQRQYPRGASPGTED